MKDFRMNHQETTPSVAMILMSVVAVVFLAVAPSMVQLLVSP